MGGLFSSPKVPKVPQDTLDAQKRAEEKAATQEREQMRQIAARKKSRRTGGVRLLMGDREAGQDQDKLGS
jgi:hypothetical protein